MSAPSPDRQVTLLDVPVALYREAQQRAEALLRELVLMAEHESGEQQDGPMRRLFRRADDGFADRLELTVRAASDMNAAHARGDAHVTLVYTLPERFAASTEVWARLMDDLDALCRDGTMLSVPSSPEAQRFAQWWCGELTRQLRDGAAPLSWPSYVAQVDALAG